MKAVIQRVTSASVTVDNQVVSKIGRGILCLIGIGTADTEYESTWLASKILNMKLFPEDKDGESWGWKNSVLDADYEVLCVSQFTLQANLRKGAKPDFHGAMGSETSYQFYEAFLADMRKKHKAERILDGQFGAMMNVQLVNDGPVTLILDSATDAPARPTPKATLTPEQKAKAKEKAAKRKATRGERPPAKAEGSTVATAGEGSDGLSEKDEAKMVQEAAGRKEGELIEEAEAKVRELEKRFESAMGHGI
ncbi:hypothetical protein JCM10207_009000 [Rhodosporidiobolus poonsookiae]